MTTLWDYTDFVHADRTVGTVPTIHVTSYDALSAIDTNSHTIALFNIEGDITQLDKSEIFEWNTNLRIWVLVEKKNATIEFNDFLYNKNLFNGWDGDKGWGGTNWDSNPAAFMQHVIHACRYDLFVEEHINNFNKLFFAIVKYAVSEHDMVDWVYKTTYVHLNIVTDIETGNNKTTKYNRSVLNEVSGYINNVKPFHTKVKTILESYKSNDKLSAKVEELGRTMKITIDTGDYLDHTTYVTENTVISSSFTDTPSDIIESTFTDTLTDEIHSAPFVSLSNLNNVYNEYRRSNVAPQFNEQVSIKVITNTSVNVVDANTRTYAYIQDNWLNTSAFSLREDRESTIDTEMSYTIPLSHYQQDMVLTLAH